MTPSGGVTSMATSGGVGSCTQNTCSITGTGAGPTKGSSEVFQPSGSSSAAQTPIIVTAIRRHVRVAPVRIGMVLSPRPGDAQHSVTGIHTRICPSPRFAHA